jgi:hypothetical protein
MSFLRSADPEAEALAVRRLNRFRSLLILVYLLLWVLLVAWMLGNPPPFPGGLTGFLHGIALAFVCTVGLVLVLVFHLFSIGVAGALFRLRLPLWLVFAATCTIGPALAVAFVVAALRLMAQ